MLDRILRLPELWTSLFFFGRESALEVGTSGSDGAAPTYRDLYVPRPVRWGNALLTRFNGQAAAWHSLSYENLIEVAEERTGLHDWGEPSQRQALEVLADCLKDEGRLTPFGRLSVRQFLLRHLANRLFVIDALKRFPEVRTIEIEEPIFIVGWYRTSTTFLHNLLSTLPSLRAPLFWELSHPCPQGDPRLKDAEPIIREVRRTRRIHRYLAPHFDTAHPMVAELPEECLHLFENAGISMTSCFISEAKSFAWWLLDQDLDPAYRFYREQLRVLEWRRRAGLASPNGSPSRQRWLLKWPYHLWHLDTLLTVFPDARVIYTHRDPLKAVPSVCSLSAIARSPMCEAIDREALGRFWLDYFEAGLERVDQARQRMPADRLCDVDHEDLMRDPVGEVRRIYDHLGLGMTDDVPERIRRHIATNPRHKNGIHRYGLEQFGLDAGEVRERLAQR